MGILLGLSLILGIDIFLIIYGTSISSFIFNNITSVLLHDKIYRIGHKNRETRLYGFLLSVSSICIYQYLYVVPMIILLKLQRKFSLMKGVIIGAVFTTLLAGSCFILSLDSLLSRYSVLIQAVVESS
jgi:hypothetical protein